MSNEPKPPIKPKDFGICAEVSGFLFKHPCGMHANYHCVTCTKPLCDQHVTLRGNDDVCHDCAKLNPNAPGDQAWRDADHWTAIDVDYDPNNRDQMPTWYRKKKKRKRRKYRGGHVHDDTYYDNDSFRDNDFNDSDEAVFDRDVEQVQNWENDMGAS